MTSLELREKFLEFFKKRGHKIVPSSSLIPDDPSVLLTTAGMQQFKKYYTEPALAPTKNVASIQKCFRTSDIDEVGDESHLTFFEMLGNFSFGGYWKKEAIKLAWEFLKELDLPPLNPPLNKVGRGGVFVTVFAGDTEIPPDEESYKIWQSLGIKDIRKAGREDNFWGPTGAEGPCGPTTEIYINGVEIWNIVFNEYYKKPDGTFEKLKTPGVDTGMGLERLAMVSQNKKNIFETDLFAPIIQAINIPRADRNSEIAKRIIADHIRAIAFLIADGLQPSNKDAGYILRRLMRRVSVYGASDTHLLDIVVKNYQNFYPELKNNRENIINVAVNEYVKFSVALKKGLNELEKLKEIDAKHAFWLYESFGLPYEVIKDFEQASDLTREQFEEEFKKHQEISRAGVEKKFGGHGLLLDTGELKAADEEELKKVTRLHTATHLLQAALRKVLGDGVKQAGSDITAERTRFDFTFERKLTDEEIKKVEDLVNGAIAQKLPVNFKEMPIEEAKKTGALYFFKEKYPEKVKVYYAGGSIDSAFSKEFCGGPHVKNTSEIGHFKILKQEAVGAGLRRIRATVD